ncbi:MAG: hypothetical protein JO262_15545 [Solirubrobacterales bacterium]|nr:hypothetical protein [Solirubrobacterales bacterium]MBV9943539.1 hypothetical protein [Solirubrobacterales bacterium]
MDADDRLRLDFEQTTGQISALMDVRFRLLGIVPTVAAAAVGIAGAHPSTGGLIGVGLLGLAATVGILLYELRNTETLAAALCDARDLARLLELRASSGRNQPAGVIRPSGRRHRLFRTLDVGQDQALGLVYGAALGGWSYLLIWGVLHGLHVSGARAIAGVIGVCCAVAVVFEVGRISSEATQAAERGASGTSATPSGP